MVDTAAQRMTMSAGTTIAPSGDNQWQRDDDRNDRDTRYRRREYKRDDDREYQYGRS